MLHIKLKEQVNRRKIIQYAHWDEEETEISVESFDENGMLSELNYMNLLKSIML